MGGQFLPRVKLSIPLNNLRKEPPMKIEDLSFAAQVLDLAEKINSDHLAEMQDSLPINSPGRDDAVAAWIKENQVIDYVPKAYELITRAARRIEELRKEQA